MVDNDSTIFDKRLFLSRYDLIIRLLRQARYPEANKELVEIREDFSGKSLAFLDYLRSRLLQARLSTQSLKETNLINEIKTIDERLIKGSSTLLREAALVHQADMALLLSTNSDETKGRYLLFLKEIPTSTLRSDVLLRLALIEVRQKKDLQALAWLNQLLEETPPNTQLSDINEKINLLKGLRNLSGSSLDMAWEKLILIFNEDFNEKESLDKLLDRLANKATLLLSR